MPYKDLKIRKEKQKRYARKSYLKHRSKTIASTRATCNAIRAKVAEIKESSPCSDCGVYYPSHVMDFDHRPGERKVSNVATLVKSGGINTVMTEIEKCDLVCANCHRQRTFLRRKHGSGAVVAKRSPTLPFA